MSAKRWYMKWCPTDWRTDDGVRSLGYAARGLWMDMLCIMHAAEPYGYLVLNGRGMTAKELANRTGGREREVERLLKELENAGVFSRNSEEIIFNRRMIRDKILAEKGRSNADKRYGKEAEEAPELVRESKVIPLNPIGVPSGEPIGNPSGNPTTLELESELELESKKEKPSLRSGTRAPRRLSSRLPEDWQPREQDLQGDFAKAALAAGCDLALETEKFRNYYRASGGPRATKLDWDAAFRLWLGNASSYQRTRPAPAQQPKLASFGWNRF